MKTAECNRKRPLKSAVTGSKSVIKTKNEQVVGRDIFRRARPCKGAKLTPGLWIGSTKEVRSHKVTIPFVADEYTL